MWKIAVKFQVGITEIINANPQVKNPNLIYPGQQLNIPTLDATKQIEEQVVELTNRLRAQNGQAALKSNWQLARVARIKAEEMRDKNYLSHESPVYGSPFKMISDFGISYRTAEENIAAGQANPQKVFNSWNNSPGHRSNMLNSAVTQIGVGYAKGGRYGHYWVQMFIG